MKDGTNESPSTRFGGSPALLTDLYQLTMAYGYWKSGVADPPATPPCVVPGPWRTTWP